MGKSKRKKENNNQNEGNVCWHPGWYLAQPVEAYLAKIGASERTGRKKTSSGERCRDWSE
jgi:hypothetical protein